MATTYDFIARNKTRSYVLIVVFVLFVSFIGWVIGAVTDYGNGGLVLALAVAFLMTFIGYYSGDKVALMTSGAQGPLAHDQQPYLYRIVENLCIAGGLPVPKVYVIPDRTINAFATGRDPKHASIAVSTGALELLDKQELEGVIAHELSHVKNFDIRYMMLVLMLVNVVTLLSRWFFYAGRFGGRSQDSRGNAGNVLAIVGIVLLVLSPIIATLVQFAVSRRRESLADASGALLTRYPAGLMRALQKIQRYNTQPMARANNATAHMFLANPFGNGKRSFSKLFMTHPPIEERIAALEAMGA